MAPLTSFEQHEDYSSLYSPSSLVAAHSITVSRRSQPTLPIRGAPSQSPLRSDRGPSLHSSPNKDNLFASLISNPGAVHRCKTSSRPSTSKSPIVYSSQAEYHQLTSRASSSSGPQPLTYDLYGEDQEMSYLDKAKRNRYRPELPKLGSRSARSRSRSKAFQVPKRTSSIDLDKKSFTSKRPRIERKPSVNSLDREVIVIDSDDDEPSPSSEPSIVEASANMLRAFRGYPSSQELDTKPSLVDSSQSANLTAQATIDRLTRELAAEREKNRTLTEARNDLQQKLCDKEVDTEKQIQLQLENETLQRQIQNIEAQYATQQQDSAKLLDEALISAQKSKAETLSLQERLTTVESQHHHMQQELTTLQTTHPGPLQPPAAVQHALSLPSPAPSSQCSSFSAAMASSAPLIEQLDEETKENNVRKMYMKTKRQYDVLHAVCSNLVTCTRSIELSSFGEFGGYVRQLRDCLG